MEIFNLDCFDFFEKYEGDKIDLVIVDLPFGQVKQSWDCKIDLQKMWKYLIKICKKNCIFCFFTTTKYGIELIESNKKYFKYDLVWEKTSPQGFFSANKMPLRKHEMIYIFGKSFKNNLTIYNPQKTGGTPYKRSKRVRHPTNYSDKTMIEEAHENKGERFPTSILKFAVSKKEGIKHPTRKPVALCEWLINTYSNEGENVLDFCMGSGSTGVACLKTNRRFIGVEKNEKIFQLAKDRLENN
jgi:site-specific DNA-methyltransferase (adenine-specific)